MKVFQGRPVYPDSDFWAGEDMSEPKTLSLCNLKIHSVQGQEMVNLSELIRELEKQLGFTITINR